jgi:hypothetical protein
MNEKLRTLLCGFQVSGIHNVPDNLPVVNCFVIRRAADFMLQVSQYGQGDSCLVPGSLLDKSIWMKFYIEIFNTKCIRLLSRL